MNKICKETGVALQWDLAKIKVVLMAMVKIMLQ